LPGCLGSDEIGTIKTSEAQRIDTCAGMIEYLEGQNLPVLESIQLCLIR